jgi:hypothetical protein
VLKARLLDRSSGFGKRHLRLLVDEIRVMGKEIRIKGSYSALAPQAERIWALGSSDVTSGDLTSFISPFLFSPLRKLSLVELKHIRKSQ